MRRGLAASARRLRLCRACGLPLPLQAARANRNALNERSGFLSIFLLTRYGLCIRR